MWVLSAPTIQAEPAERLCLVTLENCGLFCSIPQELLKLGLGDSPKRAWNDMIPKYTHSTDMQLNHRGDSSKFIWPRGTQVLGKYL